MWITFLLCCAALLALLYVPGTFAAKAVGLRNIEAIAVAPLISVALFAILGIAMDVLGLKGPQPVLLASLLFAVGFAVAFFIRKAKLVEPSGYADLSRLDFAELGIAVCVCCIAMAALFLRNIDGADSFLECSDNVFHLNVIQSMLDGASLSMLHITQYAAMDSAQAPFSTSGGFYPAGWHILISMACSMVGSVPAVGENAGAFVFSGVVFALGMGVFLKTVFPGKKGVAAVGSFTFCACAAFPLAPLVVHQVYPNFVGLCCLPGLTALFVARMNESKGPADLFKALGVLVVPVFGCAILHPNAVIAFIVTAVAFLIFYPWSNLVASGSMSVAARVGIPLGLVVAFICVWLGLMDTPLFFSVTSYLWDWTIDPGSALFSALTFGFVLGVPQLVFALFVAAGFVLCLLKSETRWLCLALTVFLGIFFFNACGDPVLKKLFAGYFYTDAERTAALAAIAGVPCAAFGLYSVLNFLKKKSVAFLAGKLPNSVAAFAVPGVVLLAFCYAAYTPCFPSSDNETALGCRTHELRESSIVAFRQAFTNEEKLFCNKTKEITGCDSLILNMPQDGSVFAYAVCGLNVYFKNYCVSGDTANSCLIQAGLSSIASDAEVRNAVIETGAKYVILLDPGDEKKVTATGAYTGSVGWEGFNGLENNSSFKLVLEDGTRKLYEIV